MIFKIINKFDKNLQIVKKSLFWLHTAVWVGKSWLIITFCILQKRCDSNLSNGVLGRCTTQRMCAPEPKMWGGIKNGTPKSRSVGNFLFWVGAKNVSVIENYQGGVLQYSHCPLGHENELFLHNELVCESKFFKMRFFGPIFFWLQEKRFLPENCLKYIEKLCGSEPFQHFSRCDRNQCIKSDRVHCYAFLVPKLRTWNCGKMKISPMSRASCWHSPCVLLSRKFEPWVSQHTHSESLHTMSACWIWNKVLREALSKHGKKWPATNFRPQFCDSDLRWNLACS